MLINQYIKIITIIFLQKCYFYIYTHTYTVHIYILKCIYSFSGADTVFAQFTCEHCSREPFSTSLDKRRFASADKKRYSHKQIKRRFDCLFATGGIREVVVFRNKYARARGTIKNRRFSRIFRSLFDDSIDASDRRCRYNVLIIFCRRECVKSRFWENLIVYWFFGVEFIGRISDLDMCC